MPTLECPRRGLRGFERPRRRKDHDTPFGMPWRAHNPPCQAGILLFNCACQGLPSRRITGAPRDRASLRVTASAFRPMPCDQFLERYRRGIFRTSYWLGNDEMNRTTSADFGTSSPAANVAASGGSANRDAATMPESRPQISIAGLLAWALPPLALIGMLIIHSA